MKIAIVDDLSADRAQLQSDMERYAANCTVPIEINQFENGEQFLSSGDLNDVDVVFLDIYMDKVNGMDVAYELRRRNTRAQIVFISSSPDFAVESYRVKAAYYMLKPYANKELSEILDSMIQNTKKELRTITVKVGREQRKIRLSDILYVDYCNHYVQLHTAQEVISSYMKFQEMEEKLLHFKEFMTCYRCITVNMNEIKKVFNLYFCLSNGENIPINRQQAKEVKARYSDYIFTLLEKGETV